MFWGVGVLIHPCLRLASIFSKKKKKGLASIKIVPKRKTLALKSLIKTYILIKGSNIEYFLIFLS